MPYTRSQKRNFRRTKVRNQRREKTLQDMISRRFQYLGRKFGDYEPGVDQHLYVSRSTLLYRGQFYDLELHRIYNDRDVNAIAYYVNNRCISWSYF